MTFNLKITNVALLIYGISLGLLAGFSYNLLHSEALTNLVLSTGISIPFLYLVCSLATYDEPVPTPQTSPISVSSFTAAGIILSVMAVIIALLLGPLPTILAYGGYVLAYSLYVRRRFAEPRSDTRLLH